MSLESMPMQVVKREAISSQIAARLRQDIFTGRYRAGQRLPAERDIADTHGVSRVTVRQALQELAREEWIEIVQGRGATVLDFRHTVGLDALSPLLAACPQAVVNPETFRAMHDFANWLYRQICVSAAINAGPGHERALMEIIKRYTQGITARDYADIERDFYNELLRIGDNLVLRMFFNTYLKTLNMLVDSGVMPLPPLPRDLFLKINESLIRAVCSNRPDLVDEVLEQNKAAVKAAMNVVLNALGIDVLKI